mmetsp:Transcript_7855/g.15711  ORF Transcript_7855/g.15711 Transcript_7855/m.15711 type:complete len:227 (-) Transcript_7855:354-1034(-)
MSDDLLELSSKLVNSLGLVALKGVNQLEHMGVATGKTLADDLEGPRHDIGTLNGDGNRDGHVSVPNKISISQYNGRTGRNIHALLDDAASALRTILLHDGRYDHGCLVVVHDGVHHIATCDADEGVGGALCKSLLNAAKLSDWGAELFPNSRVGTDSSSHGAPRTDRGCRERDSTSLSKALDEHVPAVARTFLSTEDALHGHPYVLAFNGPIHEGSRKGHVARSHP